VPLRIGNAQPQSVLVGGTRADVLEFLDVLGRYTKLRAESVESLNGISRWYAERAIPLNRS
jgi:hypothetical protein